MERYLIRTRFPGRAWGTVGKAESYSPWTGWVTVTLAEWMNAERAANFISQHPGHPATAGFANHLIEGKIEYVKE